MLQHSDLYPNLTVRETHSLFAGYYSQPRDVDEARLVGLEEKRDARVKTLSGGQKRRLDLGVALVGDPISSSWTSRRRASILPPAVRRGTWCVRSARSERRSC